MPINVSKLTRELQDVGIPIDGCSSDGRVDFKAEATAAQRNLSNIIVANHIANEQINHIQFERPFITTGTAPFTAMNVLIPQTSANFIEVKVIAVNPSGVTKFWHVINRIKRGVGAPAFVGTPTILSVVGDAGAANWMITGVLVSNNLHIDLLGENGRIDWIFSFDINQFNP